MRRFLAAAAVLALTVGCDETNLNRSQPVSLSTPVLIEILSPAAVDVKYSCDAVVTGRITNSDGTTDGEAIAWSSSNTAVFMVTSTSPTDAIATAVGVGTATITATVQSPSGPLTADI